MPAETGTTFAAVFEQLRRARGLSPAGLARKLDVQSGQVSRWRHGQGVPSIQNIANIAKLFGVDAAMLEELAGYRASTQQVHQETVDPELAALVEQDRAELQEELRGIPRPFWSAILQAQRASRRAILQGIHLMQSERISSAEGAEISSPAAARGPSAEGGSGAPGHALPPVFSLSAAA